MALTLDGTTGISASGNITGGNINGAGIISATGNIYGGNIIGTIAPASLVVSGNITGGNLLITSSGIISTAGNITGGNILGGANVNATTHTGTSVSVSGGVTAASVAGGVITGSSASVTGAVTGASLVGTITTVSQTNITSVGTLGSLSVTANITAGNLSVGTGTITGGNIVNSGANGVGNIGSATTYFNTVFAKATSAQYADLAEMYQAVSRLEEGQVVEIGGEAEIQLSSTSHSTAVLGIVSTNPSYLMNSDLKGQPHTAAVALTGRVPCYVIGNISKGDRLVSSHHAGIATALDPAQYQPGCIIGKALEDHNSSEIGTIEVAVGRT